MKAANICNTLPRTAVSKGLIMIKFNKVVIKMHRAASNVPTLFSEIPNVNNRKNVFILPGKRFPKILPKGEFAYNATLAIAISPACYFSQRSLNFNQQFASDADYIYFLPIVCMSSITYVHQ